MSDFFWIGLVVALVAIFCGYLIGHYHAQEQAKALLDKISPGVKADLTNAEADLLTFWRKHTSKSGAGTPPAPPV